MYTNFYKAKIGHNTLSLKYKINHSLFQYLLYFDIISIPLRFPLDYLNVFLLFIITIA